MTEHIWERERRDGRNKVTDYVIARISGTTGYINSNIKGITSWHEYDFNILAMLIKELFD